MSPRSARTPIPSDAPLSSLEFVAFDTETTGCAAETGRMVEIGAVRFRSDGTEISRFSQLINPLRPIPATVTRIHGITDAMVRGCRTETAVLPEFVDFLGDPARTVTMAHNAPFDLAFIGSALARTGLSAPPHVVIDTVRLSRRRAAGLPSHSLRSLVRCFGIGDTTAHRGLSDSIALQRIFLSLTARPPALRTAGDLFALSLSKPFTAGTARYRSRSDEAWRSRPRGMFSPRRFSEETTAVVAKRDLPFEIGSGESRVDPRTRLDEAIATGRAVSLIYDGGRSAGERRSVTPLRVVGEVEAVYLLAFCHVDRKQKQYRLDRIRELIVES